jgi:hypothetical protein
MAAVEETEIVVGPDDNEIIIERPDSESERLPLPKLGPGPTDPIQVSSVTGPIVLKRVDGATLFESRPETTDVRLRVRRGGTTQEAR